MKGMVYTKTGGLDVLKIQEIKKPIPKDNQFLIKVKCCSLNIIDYERFKNLDGKVPLFPRLVNFIQGGVGKPLGADISGIVEEVGKNIKHVKKRRCRIWKNLRNIPRWWMGRICSCK